MQRDMDLIRAIILKLESWELNPGAIMVSHDIENDFQVDGYTAHQISYHFNLIAENGWIDTAGRNPTSRGFTFRSLTSKGHDFADSVRDDKIWATTKEGALKAGGFTLELLGSLAKGLVKKQLEKHTGIEL